jgi:hypothetical protein
MIVIIHYYHIELQKLFIHFLTLIMIVSIPSLLKSQNLNELLSSESMGIREIENGNIVDESYFDTGIDSTIRNLTIEARATTAVLSWEPILSTEYGALQGYTIYRRMEDNTYETPIAYTGVDPYFIDSRLEMGTTYYYKVTPRIDHVESGLSDEVKITTLSALDNLYTYANLKTAVLIYKNTNAGGIPDAQIQRIKNGIEVARLFIWRNSLMKLNLQITYYEIDDYKTFGDMGDYWGSVQKTAEHLKELGVMNTQYDIIYRVSPATGGYWSYGVLHLDLPGPARQTGFSHSVWPTISGVRYPGHDLDTHYDLSWVFLHEVQHAIDVVYNASGLPQKHHGDRPHLFPYPVGEHYDFQAKMFRVFNAYEDLLSNWGGIYEAWDTGNFGFPDDDIIVPVDELRFGSNPEIKDTDGDGLSDRDEFINGIYSGSDPNDPDSNNNGVLDGNDPYPRYRVNTFIPYYTTTIGEVHVEEQMLSIDSVSYTQYGYSPKVYMGYDEDSLYIRIHLARYCSYIDLQFDFESDGWWYGRGNTEMRIYTLTGSIDRLRSQDASPEGRAFSLSIGEWAGGIWDDHPQYISHFGRRVFEKDWINIKVINSNAQEKEIKISIPRNEYAGLHLYPGDTFGLNMYYQNVNEDPGKWATTFDTYSFVNFIFHEYNLTKFAGGSGTENDPYIIETPEHLNNIRDYFWSHFLQHDDIDLGIFPWNASEGWLPIGDDYKRFSGSYDGNGFTVSNLTINRPEENWIGLFGYAHGADLRNIIVKQVDVVGGSFVGGLVGKTEQSSISDSYAHGIVSGNWTVGGLVGENTEKSAINNSHANVSVLCNGRNGGGLIGSHVSGSIISNSCATGGVSGGGSLGGLVGDHHNSSTINSFATGNISGSDLLGGLVGNHAGGSSIENSYATGCVKGWNEIGGLVGWNRWSSTITNSYAIGIVSGGYLQELVGGLVGAQDEGSISTYSYWDINTTGKITSAGGDGKTTEEMIYPYDVDVYVGWDFIEKWETDPTHSINSGYPFLRWQTVSVETTYTLILITNPEAGGTVTGEGVYRKSDIVTVVATPAEGYLFVNWTIGQDTVMDGDNPAGTTFEYSMPALDVLMIANFDIAIAATPVLVSPEDGSVGIAVDTMLIWKAAEHAETYHFQLSKDLDCTTCIVDSSGITTSSFEVSGLERLTTYYWRVKAMNEGGESDWSEIWRFTTADVTIVLAELGIPTDYILFQNYPNPFNPSTVIRYGIPERSNVILTVYNSLGQKVTTLINEGQEARFYEITFDASHLSSGVYIYRLQTGEYVESRKLLLLK